MNNTLPQYRKLYELLRKHIEEGIYREGDLLPSENELCQLYGMTRPTARQALAALAAEGFIRKQQGKGSIVRSLPRDIGILSVGGTTSALGSQNLQTLLIVSPVIQPWSAVFMFELSALERESGCIYMERLRLLDDVPVFYDINFIPNINLPRFTSRQFENKSLFEMLRHHYQLEITGGEQRLRAIPAAKTVAAHLRISLRAPVLHLERKLETNRSGFFIYSSIYCNTAEHSIFGTF
jgi:GntR family transcriptional regulator/GntR family frlABCD operon transcriptional regulator